MKEQFINKRFTGESQKLLEHIERILTSYEEQGYELSLRQLYYQLVAAAIIPNSERSYKAIGSLVNDARLAGLIDWNMILDRGRTVIRNSHWSNPADILRSAINSFQIDKWETQENYVEVMVEKQALEGVLEPVCSELDIPFSANKGYSSASAMYRAGKRYAHAHNAGKKLYVIYLGDHDPSGIDMTRDVEDRMRLFSECNVNVIRVALNMDQIEELKPPENPAKETDSRCGDYIARFGHSSWELDAIEPKALAALVREKVEELRDLDAWAKAVKREDKMKAELKSFAKMSKFNEK